MSSAADITRLTPIAPPLAVLRRDPPGGIKALLLASIRGSHADVLRFDAISGFKRDGHDVTEGEFTHLPSGRRFSLQIVEIPETEGATA
ncbi:MAG TPA: hypothetical protein VFS13_00720 [Steroidobacteraceae bacterium]|nr:hypothetical protein [Steroidobacteraceae bacterium]